MFDFFIKTARISVFFTVVLGALTSCDQEKMNFCKGDSELKYSTAIADLGPALKNYREHIITIDYQRLPASSDASDEERAPIPMERKFRLPKKEREKWQLWSEVELKKIQSYIDEVRGHRHESEKLEKINEHLGEAANLLVSFHGFCQQSRVDRMIASLKEVENQRQILKKLSCN